MTFKVGNRVEATKGDIKGWKGTVLKIWRLPNSPEATDPKKDDELRIDIRWDKLKPGHGTQRSSGTYWFCVEHFGLKKISSAKVVSGDWEDLWALGDT